MHLRILAVLAVFVFSSVAFAQEPAVGGAYGYEDSYQINYIPNTDVPAADGLVNIVNAGFHSSAADPEGWVCTNVYVWKVDAPHQEEPVACCTCPTTQNEVRYLTRADLVNNQLINEPTPSSIVVKLVNTRPPTLGNPNSCNAANLPTDGPAPGPLGTNGGFASGIRAWGLRVHLGPVGGTETEFSQVPLGPYERDKLNAVCRFIQTFGSQRGICGSCSPGALAVPATQ
jgi:hypothetical protein